MTAWCYSSDKEPLQQVTRPCQRSDVPCQDGAQPLMSKFSFHTRWFSFGGPKKLESVAKEIFPVDSTSGGCDRSPSANPGCSDLLFPMHRVLVFGQAKDFNLHDMQSLAPNPRPKVTRSCSVVASARPQPRRRQHDPCGGVEPDEPPLGGFEAKKI